MWKKIAGGIVPLIASASMQADDSQDSKKQEYYQNEYVEENYVDQDVWFGPGYYYGLWFENENDYWGWRDYHRDYPPNHNYYNHDHPMEYNHDQHRSNQMHRDGDPGRSGEFQHREGGGHGGGHGGRR
jgi:hypothetical protein